MINRISGLILLFIPLLAFSQYEQNPSSLRWRQIKTEHFVVVFPVDLSPRGIETANLLEYIYSPVSNSLNEYPKKISLFLFNQSAISNGYSTLGPRYVVFYTTPPQDANMVGGADWLQTLATHEYRHVVQFSKLDKNFTHFMGFVMGDYGKSLAMDWSVPQWFFEGDAVCTETVLSDGGRGRMPFFSREFRAMELENIRYSYDKAFLGSYKNYIPNFYSLGYLLTAYVTKNYGIESWNNVMNRTSNLSFSPFAFSGSLRKYTRSNLKNTYKNALNEYNSLWNSKIENYPFTRIKKINLETKDIWTSYNQPFFLTADSLIALKTSLKISPTLVLLTKESEKKLICLNPIDRIHSNGRIVVWSSETAALRWGQRSFADIMRYDLKKHSKKKLTRRSKYYAPAVSPDGTQIAVVEYTSQMKCALTILSASKGKVLNKFNIPDSCFIRMPSWSRDGKKIVFTQTTGQLKTISILNIENGEIKNIIPYSAENISNPVFFENFILYNSPITGIDAILAINLEDGTRFIVATGKYGIYNPTISPDGQHMALENYTINGFDIGNIAAGSSNWTLANNIVSANDEYYKYIIQKQNAGNIFDTISNKKSGTFEIKKYRPLFHSIDLHSWIPTYASGGMGLEILSNDKLNTTAIGAGFEYFPKDDAYFEYGILSYAKLFPVFDFEIINGQRFNYIDFNGTSVFSKLDEKLFKAKMSFPFNFSRNIYTTTLTVDAGYDYIFDKYPDYLVDSVNPLTINTSAIEAGLVFSNTKQMALRDIYPKFGQTLKINYWDTPFEKGKTDGTRINTNIVLYFPGIVKNHSISLTGSYGYNTNDLIGGVNELTTDLAFVRGFGNVPYTQFIQGLVVYAMPLFYPDFHIGPILNCKRVRSDIFYNYGVTQYNGSGKNYISTGLDLNAEFNFFRLPIPFEIGVRYSYRISDNKNAFDFLFMGIAF